MNKVVYTIIVAAAFFSNLASADLRSDFESIACSKLLATAQTTRPEVFVRYNRPTYSRGCSVTAWNDDSFSITYNFSNYYKSRRFIPKTKHSLLENATTRCTFTNRLEWTCAFTDSEFTYLYDERNSSTGTANFENRYNRSSQKSFNNAILAAINEAGL